MRKSAGAARRVGARLLYGSVLGAVLCAVPATSALAQSADQLLPPTREEVTRPVSPPIQPRGPRLDVEGEIQRSPCALDGPDFQAIKLTLRDVQFEGLQGLAPSELTTSYSQYVGTEQPISVVCEIRDRAATILREAGYIAAVQVPEQRIADGVVRFRVLMAKLTQVRVRGDASGAESIIAGYLNRLVKQPVFNRFEAERYLLLASDLPGYSVRLTLRPAGTVPGEVIGDVAVQRMPFYADANIQNAGSKSLGRIGGLIRGQAFGLTGLGDRTTVSLFSTSDFREQQTVQLGHDFHLGAEGLSISGSGTFAWARPSIDGDADVKARTKLGTIEVGYPLIRRQSKTLRGSVGMDLVNQDVDLDGIDLTRDRLRVAFGRLGFDALSSDFSAPGRSLAEPLWRFSSLLELRRGLHILNATRDCGPTGADCLGVGQVPPSRLEGQSDATVARGTVYGELRPIPKVTVALGLRGQYARKPLLSFEEFSAGNYTAGRGYDPGVLIGDSGFGTQAELRFGSRAPASARAPGVESFLFWDHAKVSNRDKLLILDQSDHLDSIGAGARISFNRFSLDATLAAPLTKVGLFDKRPEPRFLFSLTSRLWPWSYR
jgi:hemolysin activation/secretion protein